eukprot:c19790_g3_i2.p1 GENE.c19790_g3_i2~~c19790_g3_i2.p1  ORF type:complete len:217 (+),score=45.33 c19790_g3_i2:29-679(+)
MEEGGRRVNYCAVLRRADNFIVVSHTFAQDEVFKNRMETLIHETGLDGSTKATDHSFGVLHRLDVGEFVYFANTIKGYPKDSASNLLLELSRILGAFAIVKSAHSLVSHSGLNMRLDQLLDQYDRLSATEQVAQELKNTLRAVGKLDESVKAKGDHLNDLESAAAHVKEGGEEFRVGAAEVNRRTWLKKKRMQFIVGAVAGSGLVYVLLSVLESAL